MAISEKARKMIWLLLCGFLLGGCAEDAEVSDRDERTVITVWTNSAWDLEYLRERADVYNRENTQNIYLEVSLCSGNYEQAIEMADSLNELPDILYADLDQGSYYDFCRKGMFLELSPYLTQEQTEAFQGGICTEVDESVYRIYSGADYGILCYNKKILERCGITEPPGTMADLAEMAKRITRMLSGNGIYGFGQNMKDSAFDLCLTEHIARDFGIYQGYDYRRGRYDFMVYETALGQMQALLDEECAMPGCETLSMDALRALFAQGKIAMYFGDSREERVYKNLFPAGADSFGAAPFPTGGVSGCNGVVPVHFSGGWLVSSGSRNRQEALTVLWELFYSEEFLQGYYGDTAEGRLFGDGMEKADLDMAAKAGCLPEAPHVINKNAVLTPGRDTYDVFYNIIYGDTEIKDGLQKLTESYNTAYCNGIRSESCGRLYLPEYQPADPEKTVDLYREMVLPLYRANAADTN